MIFDVDVIGSKISLSLEINLHLETFFNLVFAGSSPSTKRKAIYFDIF